MDRVEQFVLSGSTYGNYRQSSRDIASPYGFIDVHLNVGEGPTEVPDFMLDRAVDYALRNIGTVSFNLVYRQMDHTQRRLVRGALSDFNRAYSCNSIASVTMSNGVTYYGLPGAIFDSEFNLLMLMSSMVEIKSDEGTITAHILRHICRVSPVVFQRQENILEKTIVKKVIPFCASHEVTSDEYLLRNTSFLNCEEVVGKTISVFIDATINEKFIRRIVPPRPNDFTEEYIHELLIRNAREILDDNR